MRCCRVFSTGDFEESCREDLEDLAGLLDLPGLLHSAFLIRHSPGVPDGGRTRNAWIHSPVLYH